MQRDFWGRQKKEKKDKFEIELNRYDNISFTDRLKRLRIISDVVTSPSGYLLPSAESFFLFEDAKNCYINGQFAACILVCQSLLEHHLKVLYRAAGKNNITRIGFKKLLGYVITDKILPEFVTLKLEGLRKKRNPLVHMAEDPLGYYWKKALELNCKVEDLLEQDAKDAILLTFEIINRRPFVF